MADKERHDLTHFDAIGDIHGCYYELIELVTKLGYVQGEDDLYRHPDGRKMVSLGDLCDRGWYNSICLQFILAHWLAGEAEWVAGNHDNKLFRWMKGNPVRPSHGLQKTITELEQAWPFDMEREELGTYLLENVPTRLFLDDGAVVAVHASNGKHESDHIYGRRGGPDNERIPWWDTYEGPEFVVFGHYWMNDPEIREHWCCVDTSCVCGEDLTAMRWPEREIVSVKASQVYYEDDR